MTIEDINKFCAARNYDLRISGNGRWIDQKCTPDVLWSISDFVLNYVDNISQEFTPSDIWMSEYAKQTISETFSKPGTDEESAQNEYDKVFSQPLNLLCYAGVINDVGTNGRHRYKINNRDVLVFIARNDICSLRFLQCYIEKVLKDSELFILFQKFFDQQDKTSFNLLKTSFIEFYHKYTPIKGDLEPKRIFTKVINPLAFKYGKKGAQHGRISSHNIKRSDMMYNQDNFRDIYTEKPKEITRQEWLLSHPRLNRRDGYFEQMMNRAKRILKEHNNEYRSNVSELTQFVDGFDDYTEPTQIHHIFPKSDFPEIKHFLENLISLTPNQHYGFAHPNNNTQAIDIEAQKTLLIAKTCSISKNLTSTNEESIYEFDNLLLMLCEGWNDEKVLEIKNNDFVDVLHFINIHYDM